jgi:hypothetical protein
MVQKFVEATKLWTVHFVLISSIVLTVWLPGSLFAEYLLWNVPSDDEVERSFRIATLIESIFGPIYRGALVYALAQIKQGGRPGYFEAISVGLRHWGRLFAARFIAGVLVLVGLLAFIVPAIVLMVRYAFIDVVVIVDGIGGDRARRTSSLLTRGIQWQIFLAALLFTAIFMPLAYAIRVPYQQFFPALNTMATDVAVDCVLNVVYAIFQVVIFLYYWQATEPVGMDPEAEMNVKETGEQNST